MNKVIFMGRLCRDPEVKETADGKKFAKYTIAVDRRFAQEKIADFFICTAFGKQGEFVAKYLRKGTKILMSGRIQNDNYTKKDGQKVYGVQIFADEIEFAESKKAEQETPVSQAEENPFPKVEEDNEFLPFN